MNLLSNLSSPSPPQPYLKYKLIRASKPLAYGFSGLRFWNGKYWKELSYKALSLSSTVVNCVSCWSVEHLVSREKVFLPVFISSTLLVSKSLIILKKHFKW